LRKWIKCGELFPQDQPWDIGWLPVAIYRATDAILNSKFGHFFKKGVLELILIVEIF
jgi:hypothetical protein